MIIKIHKAGRSFKGVSRYLLHDAGTETAKRVAWTHTVNLAHDLVSSAVDEMLWTFRSADVLKRAAGVSTGGSKLDKPVKHFSLCWPQGETPAQDHMIETVQAYMAHMGWAQHQAVLVAHNDTRHAHVHVVMNLVSPVDGRAARSFRDWRHSEDFALAYERAHEQIHCEQRLKPREARDPTPTRESWQRFRKSEIEFDRTEVKRVTATPDYFARHDDKSLNSREWMALKSYQQHQREQFFIDGKEAFRAARKAAFREVREEFRDQWSALYTARRHGHDPITLAEMKVALVAAQNHALDKRREEACALLREERDEQYKTVLAQQRFDRAELTRRQEQGLRTYALMDVVYPSGEAIDPARSHAQPPRERKTDAVDRAATERMFVQSQARLLGERSADGVPVGPGVVLRRPTPAPQSEKSGNEPHEARVARQHERLHGLDRTHEPRSTTQAHTENPLAEKAQRMADERKAKEGTMAAAELRASWNRHRRWRGGRE